MALKEVSSKELKKMNVLAEQLIKRRGECIHWMSEIESELDELIIYNFIKKECGKQFFEILLWEDFRFRTKIRLFGEIPLHDKDTQSQLVKELGKLASIRNKYAHCLSIVTLEETFLINKKLKPYKVDDEVFDKFKERALKTLWALKAILLSQKGIDPKTLGSAKMVWMPTDKMKSGYS